MKEISDKEMIHISPHMLNAFVISPKYGIEAYYRSKYKKHKEPTKEMSRGIELHEKLGYNNQESFEKTFKIDVEGEEYLVHMKGIPDKLEPLTELKTTESFFIPDKKIEAAKAQMLCYLFLTDKLEGLVKFVNSLTEKEIKVVHVYRNDLRLKELIRKFIRHLKKQKQLSLIWR